MAITVVNSSANISLHSPQTIFKLSGAVRLVAQIAIALFALMALMTPEVAGSAVVLGAGIAFNASNGTFSRRLLGSNVNADLKAVSQSLQFVTPPSILNAADANLGIPTLLAPPPTNVFATITKDFHFNIGATFDPSAKLKVSLTPPDSWAKYDETAQAVFGNPGLSKDPILLTIEGTNAFGTTTYTTTINVKRQNSAELASSIMFPILGSLCTIWGVSRIWLKKPTGRPNIDSRQPERPNIDSRQPERPLLAIDQRKASVAG